MFTYFQIAKIKKCTDDQILYDDLEKLLSNGIEEEDEIAPDVGESKQNKFLNGFCKASDLIEKKEVNTGFQKASTLLQAVNSEAKDNQSKISEFFSPKTRISSVNKRKMSVEKCDMDDLFEDERTVKRLKIDKKESRFDGNYDYSIPNC